ncbi:MAG: hypothetical protein AABW80_02330 [Nanoarchaeota archaeon]
MKKIKFEFEIGKRLFLIIGVVLFFGMLIFVQAYNGNFDGTVAHARDVLGISATEVLVKLSSGQEVSVQSFFGGSAEGGELPSGSIIMFDTACPTGWTRFTDLDGRVPKGAVSYGGIGGADTHNHTWSATIYNLDSSWRPAVGSDFAIDHSSSWPPYINVVWCKKT